MKARFASAGYYDADRSSVTIELIGTTEEVADLVNQTLHYGGLELPVMVIHTDYGTTVVISDKEGVRV